jgi:membrane-associated phospholipid phosphatase
MESNQPADTKQAKREIWLRVLAGLLLLGVSLLYFPINRSVSGGVSPNTFLDEFIPLWAVWAVPYIFSIFWWLAALIWICWRIEIEALKTVVTAFLIMTLTSYVVYILFPTFVVRPEPVGGHWTMDLIRWIYGSDQPYNALPSGHTYNTVIIGLILWYWKPRLRWLWVATIPTVILATLFTKQHYVMDPLFGLLWAYGSFFLARKLAGWPLSSTPPSISPRDEPAR